MIIAVAGPYSAPTEEKRWQNLEALNNAAAQLLEMGHTPVIGVNAALPVVERAAAHVDRYKAIMEISMAVVAGCDALLLIAGSPGANQERDLILSKSRPVFYSLNEVPLPEAPAP
jgi:hypothetical protein